jgi:hypothetical protein
MGTAQVGDRVVRPTGNRLKAGEVVRRRGVVGILGEGRMHERERPLMVAGAQVRVGGER